MSKSYSIHDQGAILRPSGVDFRKIASKFHEIQTSKSLTILPSVISFIKSRKIKLCNCMVIGMRRGKRKLWRHFESIFKIWKYLLKMHIFLHILLKIRVSAKFIENAYFPARRLLWRGFTDTFFFFKGEQSTIL